MNDAGKYCDNGKRIEDANKIRERNHGKLKEIDLSIKQNEIGMAELKKDIGYIKDKVDKIDENLEKKVDRQIFFWIVLGLCSVAAVIASLFSKGINQEISSFKKDVTVELQRLELSK